MKLSYEDFARSYFDVVSQSGNEINAKCPWHNDSAPSLRVNVASGLYICHGCGKKGHLNKLAGDDGQRVGAPDVNLLDYVLRCVVPTATQERVLSEAFLTPLTMTVDYWLKVRKLSMPTIRRFQLGQDLTRNTATIPFRSESGALLGIVERQLGGNGPKYRYPPGYKKNMHLFASWQLGSEHDTVCLVEGPVDALAMWDAGVPALAISGSSMSAVQIDLLKKMNIHHVVIFTDNDEAGTHAMQQIIDSLVGTGIFWSFAQYGADWPKDPAALQPNQRRLAYSRAKSQMDITLS